MENLVVFLDGHLDLDFLFFFIVSLYVLEDMSPPDKLIPLKGLVIESREYKTQNKKLGSFAIHPSSYHVELYDL